MSEVWHQRLAVARDERERQQRWRNRRVSAHGALDFAGNDYLGLAQDPRVQAAQAEGAKRFGAGAGASHLVSGHLGIHDALKRRWPNGPDAKERYFSPRAIWQTWAYCRR